jgi:hypothetical protein
VFTAATDAFTQHNIGMTVDASIAAFRPVLCACDELGWWRRAYVSTAFGCPYTGRVEPAAAVAVAERLLVLGVDEVCFGDTIGVGVPDQVADSRRDDFWSRRSVLRSGSRHKAPVGSSLIPTRRNTAGRRALLPYCSPWHRPPNPPPPGGGAAVLYFSPC